ncbi:Uncharacterised protein [Chlamydia abortus]|nr:Uncharacterised protein [Chlamydia abortus]
MSNPLENKPCVAATITFLAPFSFNAFTALIIVPPVSIMSSKITTFLFSTSPSTPIISHLLGPVLLLSIIAISSSF